MCLDGAGEPHLAQLDHPRLLLLAHPGVREGWNGDGQQMYGFFRSAVMNGHDAWTIVSMGKNQYGNSFHFWWRPEVGGSEATIDSFVDLACDETDHERISRR